MSIESSRIPRPKQVLHPIIPDQAPTDPPPTSSNEERMIGYIRLLDAQPHDAGWKSRARVDAPFRSS
jgi:hypothetical protein